MWSGSKHRHAKSWKAVGFQFCVFEDLYKRPKHRAPSASGCPDAACSSSSEATPTLKTTST